MASNTPRFDAALDKIFVDLKPHTRTCAETGESFEITERDIEMFRLLRVPPPKTVWWVAMRRQQAFFAGYDLFYRQMSDGSFAVSFYDPEAPVPVMSKEQWRSDDFDIMVYGRSVDIAKPFFEQWIDFSRSLSWPSHIRDERNVNGEWVSYGVNYKNGYGCVFGLNNEDIIYSDSCGWCKNALELTLCGWCEYSYDCVVCMRSSRLRFCERCGECIDLTFCLACKNCTDCFGCTNLRNKKFCFLNEQLGEEEYRKRLSAIDLTDSDVLAEWRERMAKVWALAFRRGVRILRSEDAIGDEIEDSRNVYGVSIYNSERTYGSFGSISCRDTVRSFYPLDSELCYESGGLSSSNTKFSLLLDHCIDVEYSSNCWNCEHCFGCVGLKYKKFCVFNKQYTEGEYWPLVDEIKIAMLRRGEYGEFFPYAASPFAYNLSHSGMMFPLSKKEVQDLNTRWYEFPDRSEPAEDAAAIPKRLSEVEDSITTRHFRCPATGRIFFFTAPQLKMHRELGVALPRVHPTVNRIRRTLASLPPRLFSGKCDSCDKQFETRIPPEHTAPVLCSSCYEQVVIGEKPAPISA